MYKFYILLLLTSITFSCSSSTSKNEKIDIIDVSNINIVEKYDIESLLEDTIQAIALEISDEFVIGEISHIKYSDDRILICDKMSEAVYLYDANTGKAMTKIYSPGRGPEEYLEMADVDMYNNMIVIFDYVGRKLLFYTKEGDFIKTISTNDIWGEEILVSNNNLYIINPDSETNMGFYHFFKLNNDDTFTPILNFNEREYGWGIDRFSCANNSNILFVLPPSDTIMMLGKNGADPIYKVHFGEQKISEETLKGDALDVLKFARNSTQTKGLDAIYQFGDDIAFKYSNSVDDFYAIYNTKNNDIIIVIYIFTHLFP